METDVKKSIESEKIIVIVRGVESEKLIPLAEAMYKGGIRLLEITYSADGKVSDEETAQNIKDLAEHFDGKMFIGAGTVITEKQVELTHKAGGKFIISPDTYPEVIEKTKEFGLISIPGALTPSEIRIASRCGADYVKLFPITRLGCDYVKDVKAPLSDVKLMAVGGINLQNMLSYFDAGVVGIGISSGIIDKEKLKNNDYDGITTLAKEYVDTIKKR